MTKNNKIINLKHPTPNTTTKNNNYIQINNNNDNHNKIVNIINNNIINNNIIIKNNNSPPPQPSQHSCSCHSCVANNPPLQSAENISLLTPPKPHLSSTQSAEILPPASSPNNAIIAYNPPTQPSFTCAACRYFRRKCPPNCPLSPYFPPQKHQEFLNAHKLFGVSFILKTLNSVRPAYHDDAMTSIIYSANARARDPVGGCVRIIQTLVAQLNYALAELDYVRALNRHFRAQLQPVHLLHSSEQVSFQNDINLQDNLPAYDDTEFGHSR